jgi:hypothetical protein
LILIGTPGLRFGLSLAVAVRMNRIRLAVPVLLLGLALSPSLWAAGRTDYSVERARVVHPVYIPGLEEMYDATPEQIIRQFFAEGQKLTVEVGPSWKDGRMSFRTTDPRSGTQVFGTYNPQTWHGFKIRKVEMGEGGQKTVTRWRARPAKGR